MPIGTIFNDTLFGNNTSEVFLALAGNDLVFGYAGNDTIKGASGNDRLYGMLGNDSIDGGSGNDYISGGDGNDNLAGGGGTDTIYGGAGNDIIRSSGFGLYDGGDGNDYIYAATGTPETLRGGAGVDWLNTTHWNQAYTINLVTGLTNYAGESFTQFENLSTGGGNDRLTGTAGANSIYSGAGNDTVSGGGGNDYLYGSTGNDSLHGGSGNDTVSGGAGKDTIIGSSGADRLYGGADNDSFRFFSTSESSPTSGYDIIEDFQGAGPQLLGAIEDRIDLSAIDANVFLAGNQTFTFTGTTPGGIGTVWLQNVGTETWVRVNTDFDATAEMTIRLDDGAISAANYWAGDFIL